MDMKAKNSTSPSNTLKITSRYSIYQNSKFVALAGFDSTNDFHAPSAIEPIKHLVNKKLTDVDHFLYGYSHFTPTYQIPTSTDEPVGYSEAEDPYDTRSNLSIRLMIIMMFFIFVVPFSVKISSGTYTKTKATFNMRLAAAKLEDKIRMMRLEREELQNRLNELIQLNSAK